MRVSRLVSWTLRALWSWARRNADVRAGSRAARRFAAYGPGTSIAFPPATIFGEPWIELGAHTLLGADITLTAGMVPGLDLGPRPLIRIGDGCTIGRGSHVVAHRSIEVGDDVFTGPYVYITDQNHVYADIDVPVGRQWPADAPVRIGAGTWIGANAVVLPGARLGRNCVVAASSVVRPGDYPDYSVIAGVPGRIVRRYDPEAGWVPPLRGSGTVRPAPSLDGGGVAPPEV
ncbi:acyltransferase [Streptomonospora nanhaiensis]|uniref:Acetyltransferase-like isoleucine patch superfamily enzyme n=1 Tax=Streptomonospora nanhaiensis TaxID=1323731 RepID=A0A853BNU1_9ACTN|nr:acyltransferase [Streptomonospora nanhaiensis]MBV2362062.1 acyltransferase [Streptomonospora nanhaiensis]MBX9389940.1 acyltransferase [Streptomonospora nanhaiensis]NYI96112.1 acetyltransferase-like isoleucine patch superfamily enzyme [Streptomonospora nanhaiensis]